MGFAETVALGAIAGSTIFIGLPLGRMHEVQVKKVESKAIANWFVSLLPLKPSQLG